MSFNMIRTNNQNSVDVRNTYKQLAQDFCQKYYSCYDNKFSDLSPLYLNNSQFTFLDNEIVGFNDLINKLKSIGLYQFTHYNMNVISQPLGNNNVIININGTISFNGSIFTKKFLETIILERNNLNNNFYVISTIFKTIE